MKYSVSCVSCSVLKIQQTLMGVLSPRLQIIDGVALFWLGCVSLVIILIPDSQMHATRNSLFS